MKAKAFVFDSDYGSDLKESEIENGVFSTSDKDFIVENSRPFLLRKSGLLSRLFGDSVIPVYFMKWNSLIPAKFEQKEKKGKLKDQLKNIKDEHLKKELETMIKEDKDAGEKEYIYRELVPVDISFPDAFKYNKKDKDGKKVMKVITPEMINSIADMRFLKGFKNYAGGETKGKKKWMDIAFIGGVGIFIVVAMFIGGVMTF